jgi:hypothetical protein
VIEVLERIAEHRKTRQRAHRTLFTAIANCGFPEAQHDYTALAICAEFARQAGFEHAGGLALGGGSMVNGRPLSQAGGPAARIRKSLELAAGTLAQGQSIPKSAQDMLARPAIPAWAYRAIGSLGWRQGARTYKSGKLLKRRPYAVEAK